MDKDTLLGIVKSEMITAMGCTEPAASALAGAKARDLVAGFGLPIDKVEVFASRDLIKNAMGVGLPGCGLRGIQAAVALGIAGGDISKGLEVLASLTKEQVEAASKLRSSLTMAPDVPPLYIRVRVSAGPHTAEATIAGKHDNLVNFEIDGVPVEGSPRFDVHNIEETGDGARNAELASLSPGDILKIAKRLEREECGFLLDAVETNLKIAREGLVNEYGLRVGHTAYHMYPNSSKHDTAYAMGAALAAAGSDARMAGCPMGVVINAGSGNQGIMVTVPVYAFFNKLEKKDEMALCRALFISQAMGLALAARKGRLSPTCGAFTAAIAVSCAYVHLLGGDGKAMDRAVNIMVGSLSGMICDGAKMTCPLKIHSSLIVAGLAAEIAMKGREPGSKSGICADDGKGAMDSLARLSNEGMTATDKTILSIMLEKNS